MKLPEVPMSIYTMAKIGTTPANATDSTSASDPLKAEIRASGGRVTKVTEDIEEDVSALKDAATAEKVEATAPEKPPDMGVEEPDFVPSKEASDGWDIRVPRVEVDPDKFDYLDPSIFHSLHALPEVSWRTPLSGIPPQVEQVSFH